jgi:[ribosomal protein S18]-alanine N-acetyltransferase
VKIVEGNGLDVAAIMPVMETAFDPRFSEAWTAAQCLATLALPGSRLIYARDDNGVQGFALSRCVADEEELLLIAVDESVRRKGVARTLIEAMIVNARDYGRAVLFLEVREGNPAFSFYQKAGFSPVGRRNGYYRSHDGTRHDAITMSLLLN